MLISNFNLCKTEWLDLVFAKRNKDYGAYYLRQHYSNNLVKAMAITFISIAGAAFITGVMMKEKPVIPVDRGIIVEIMPPPIAPPKTEPRKAIQPPAKPAAPTKIIKFTTMVPTDKPNVVEPPTMDELKTNAVGPENIDNRGTAPVMNVDPESGKGAGAGAGTEVVDVSIHKFAEVMPEPEGGAAEWAKFLHKNLKYSAEAIDHNISGRVFISFVVEKDGRLSNIMVDRGVGFGLDEEAARVLKLAKAWKPGRQNGQPVRVKYTLPINFSLAD